MKKVFFLVLILTVAIAGFGQSVIRGKVIDESGEPLTGATVFLKSNNTVGTITDFDGNYSLKVASETPQTIVISFISYKTIEETVDPKNNKVIIRDFVMSPSTVEIDDVVVTAKMNKSKDVYMQLKKMRSATSIDFISSETIKKTGDSDIHDATKRITGVSTVGSFITVRGLADRYIKTTVNGLRIPTLDPFTNNIELDIFPTSLVDNIVISKTITPKLPGDCAGAYLSIETKDYPEKLMININSSFGFNPQTTFKEIVFSERVPTDWLGYDNGFRDIPHFSRSEFPIYTENPMPYKQFEAIGLQDFLSEYGIRQNNLFYGSEGSIYYRLGLVELGLLPPALIYTDAAIQDAQLLFTEYHTENIFKTINQPVEDFSKLLPNNMSPIYAQAPFDFSQEINIGNQVELFGKPLGFLVGLRYHRSTNYDPMSKSNRGTVGSAAGVVSVYDSLVQAVSNQTHGWSALFHMAYKLSPNHSISLMYMPNFNGENKVRKAGGIIGDAEGYTFLESQQYEQRKQLIYQYKSTHFFPAVKSRLDLHASYTDGSSSIPDFKEMIYYFNVTEGDSSYFFSNIGLPVRYFRYLDEDIFDSHADLEIPVFEKPNLPRKIIIGAAYQEVSRGYKQYGYRIEQNRIGNDIIGGDIAAYFDSTRFLMQDELYIPLYYNNDTTFENYSRNFATGYSRSFAGYAMVDYSITPRFRLTGGLRIESTDIFSDNDLLLGLPDDHIKRQIAGVGELVAYPAVIKDIHFLPSANFIYKLVSSDRVNINSRINYSKAIARPSIREVTYTYVYDYEYRLHVLGNPDLEIVKIDNYDFRLESFFANGDHLSLSLFYKDFINHIEVVDAYAYNTWSNADESRIIGLELEGRKVFLRNFELRANVTLVDSESTLNLIGYGVDKVKQSMFGQAPYVVNGLISYQSEKLGLGVSVSYNIQGPKLAIVSDPPLPNIFELPRQLLDVKISKSIGNHFNLNFKARNLLNSEILRAYEYDNWSLIYDSYRYGRDYRISLSYDL